MNTITHLKWGSTSVSDRKIYKDAIVSSWSASWDWTQFDLHHVPGYTSDVMLKIYNYIEKKYPNIRSTPNFLIFVSVGMHRAIQTPSRSYHEFDSYTTFLQSEECAESYNEHVIKGYPGIIFLHSTC